MPTTHQELAIDVETYSSNNIKFGAEKYVNSEDFEVLIVSYQFFQTKETKNLKVPQYIQWDFLSEEPIQTIDLLSLHCSQPSSLSHLIQIMPDHRRFWEALVDPTVTKTAYNAHFERTTLRALTQEVMPPEQWKDTMILAASLGLPRSLDAVGKALNLKEEDRKMKEGKALIRYFSQPYTDRNTKKICRHFPSDSPEDLKKWQTYLTYNKQDVQTEHTILKKLLRFRPNPNEERLWDMDQKINDRGVCLDIPMARNIVAYEDTRTKQNLSKAQEITGLSNPNSVPQLLNWLTITAASDFIFCLSSLNTDQIGTILSENQKLSKDQQLSDELIHLLTTYRDRPRLKGIYSDDPKFGPDFSQQVTIKDPDYQVQTISYIEAIREQYHQNPKGSPKDSHLPGQKPSDKVSGNQKQLVRRLAQYSQLLAITYMDNIEVPFQSPNVPDILQQSETWLKSSWTLNKITALVDTPEIQTDLRWQKIYTQGNQLLSFIRSLQLPLDFSARKDGYSKSDTSEEAFRYDPALAEELRTWLTKQGKIVISNLSKATVSALLEDPRLLQPDSDHKEICDDIRTVLKLRQELSKTSIKKYETMLNTATYNSRTDEYRGHDLIQFYGARTGRFSGAIIQPQNLARNTIEDARLDDAHIAAQTNQLTKLENREKFPEGPENILSQLVRTAFIPSKDHSFVITDFSAIEARALSYLAGVDWRIQAFREGKDIYCESASQIFGVPVVKHGVNGELRAQGKVAELACGYGGGTGAMKRMDFNHVINNDEKYQEIVQKWRDSSPQIPQMWRDFESAAHEAIKLGPHCTYAHPTYVYRHDPDYRYKPYQPTTEIYGTYAKSPSEKQDPRTGFYFYIDFVDSIPLLRLHLPSGRFMTYWGPKINQITNAYNQATDSITFLVQNQTTRKWERQEWWGGTFVENAVQAYCRDILCAKMTQVEANPDYAVVFHIHDEMVVDVPTAQLKQAEQTIDNIMAQPVSWASNGRLISSSGSSKNVTLPLKGGTYTSSYYKKD